MNLMYISANVKGADSFPRESDQVSIRLNGDCPALC